MQTRSAWPWLLLLLLPHIACIDSSRSACCYDAVVVLWLRVSCTVWSELGARSASPTSKPHYTRSSARPGIYIASRSRSHVCPAQTLDAKKEWNKHFEVYIRELDKKKPVIWAGDLNVAPTALGERSFQSKSTRFNHLRMK